MFAVEKLMLGNGVTVARLTLDQVVLVRIQVPQPKKNVKTPATARGFFLGGASKSGPFSPIRPFVGIALITGLATVFLAPAFYSGLANVNRSAAAGPPARPG